MVGRSAHDLADLKAQNKQYERNIVNMLNKQKRNEALMHDLERERALSVENEKLYGDARSQYRESERALAEEKVKGLGLRAKKVTSYLDVSQAEPKLMKRKHVMPESGAWLFGQKALFGKKFRAVSGGNIAVSGGNTEGPGGVGNVSVRTPTSTPVSSEGDGNAEPTLIE